MYTKIFNAVFKNGFNPVLSSIPHLLPKIQNDFWFPIKMLHLPILRLQYWAFPYCFLYSYRPFDSKNVAPHSLLDFFPSFFFISSWLFLFYITKNIALPTNVAAIVVALLRS